MQSHLPKQYLPLAGRTVLGQTLTALACVPGLRGIATGIAAGDGWWPETQQGLDGLNVPIMTFEGGQERADTVLRGLEYLAGQAAPDDRVLVHDAVRPCVRVADIQNLIDSVGEDDNGGLLALPVTDTVKSAEQGRATATVDRSALWRAQTPQFFPIARLTEALNAAIGKGSEVTDEASAMEQVGARPLLVEGHADNLKITFAEDLAMAEWILGQQHDQGVR